MFVYIPGRLHLDHQQSCRRASGHTMGSNLRHGKITCKMEYKEGGERTEVRTLFASTQENTMFSTLQPQAMSP